MATKRVHQIAKDQGLPSAEVLMKLRAAGLDVTAAQSEVEEADALRALKGNGGGAARPRPAARPAAPGGARPAAPGARPAAPGARPAPGQRPAAGARPGGPPRRVFEPDDPGSVPSRRVFEPEEGAAPLRLPRRQDEGPAGPRVTVPRPAARDAGAGIPAPPRPAPRPAQGAGAAPEATPRPAAPDAPQRPAGPKIVGRAEDRPQARAATPPAPAARQSDAPAPAARRPDAPAPSRPASRGGDGRTGGAPGRGGQAPAGRGGPGGPSRGSRGTPARGGQSGDPRRAAAPGIPAPPPPKPRQRAEPPAPPAPEPEPEPTPAAEATPEVRTPESSAAAAAPPAEAGKLPPNATRRERGQTGGPAVVGGEPQAPAPGTGPKILGKAPDPPKNRAGSGRGRGEGGPGAGRRRVVIDSQASRRPGGPGGGMGGPRPKQRNRRRRRDVLEEQASALDTSALARTDKVRVNSGSTVRDVAEYLGVAVAEIIKKLMGMGELVTLTQTLSDEQILVLAEELGKEVELVHVGEEADDEPAFVDPEDELEPRPPVVTIMGHVDHGKTSLLDVIRETDVVAGEAGGITQHIGAYQVVHDGGLVTFLDTPGHEAFTAMRARGARVTDVAIVVVAADDGVKPQTREAIDHAKAADVPIVVAVNKIDKEGADPTRVRTEMTQLGLQPAEWGGETEFVDVSAKTREGIDTLLETILVVTELQEIRSNPNAEASGVVIEAKLDPGRGPVATLLIQRGTLKVGDALVAGSEWGKVRAMQNERGERGDAALPGTPVEVLGMNGVPDAGIPFKVVENERVARTQANERAVRLRNESHARRSGRKVSFEELFEGIRAGSLAELNLVLKADVAGSLEAFEDEIAKLPQDEVVVNIIRSGVGGITESDVVLAAASDAVILGFNVRPVGAASEAAEREGVQIRTYSVIYKALDDLRDAMSGLLAPEEVEETIGTIEVRQTFRASRIGTIAGSYVTDGLVRRGSRVRIVRDGTVVYDTTIASLKRFNEDVREVASGYECGIVLANYQDIKEGDVLEAYETRSVERALA